MKKKSTHTEYMNAVGLILQQARIEQNISQDDLAAKAGLHRTYVSLIERRCCNFSIKVLCQLANALGLSPAEVMTRAEAMIAAPRRRVKAA